MRRKLTVLFLILTIGWLGSQAIRTSHPETVILTIESWRTDDVTAWNRLISVFEAENPGIQVRFMPTNPPDYNPMLAAKFKSGTAGDLITCRPFDVSLPLFNGTHLIDLSTLSGLQHFNTFARHAWSTPDGKAIFCVPIASVLHGFIYNKDYFDRHGFKEPQTYEDFLALLDAIQKEGSMIPLAMGTLEGWTTTTMGFDNIGPNFWGGDDGRKGLLDGTRRFNDPGFVSAFDALSKWSPYLPANHQTVSYVDSQDLFTSGKSAIFPAGSWEISLFETKAHFRMGAFKAPLRYGADKCYIEDQIDIAMGMNSDSKHPQEAQRFLEFMTSEEFARLYTVSLPGFFSLSDYRFVTNDVLADTFLSWRGQCGSTMRSSYEKLDENPVLNTEESLWQVTSQLLQGKLTAQQAGDRVQARLDSWYRPSPSTDKGPDSWLSRPYR
ncbi:MAG TPA: ABC transporter substrate-binding protein [Aggregatilineales bacterium]|nr:ABC transporter substrate-binding protein [Aggregatilineales bacterium]